MSKFRKRYKSNFVEIDLNKNQYKLEFGKKWISLPKIVDIQITQVNMTQNAGGRAGRVNHKYKAYCVYIKSKESHLMVYRGDQRDAVIEKQKLTRLFKNQNLNSSNNTNEIVNEKAENKLPLMKILLILLLFILPLILLLRLMFGS